MRLWLLRLLNIVLGVGGALLFLAGAISLTSKQWVAGILPPTLAVVLGGTAFCLWLVLSLVMADAVKAKPRRRP
ncbi:hypothetical protein [Arthrobacter glacialis]|uniref:Uncharacterized protein n=1 Tax=Arthrobacter glacialis TaxID=1664 RepID=A0A2S3ZVX0_ARTGL|nr:hypothetical protein [Arthrobacter glacialis]POH58602.1 hypothetical protein CVS28_10670 [Arthrobacter glacialis]POH73406.1 hypothetical protein CVS27_10875 [Arthrobacter glacialis]